MCATPPSILLPDVDAFLTQHPCRGCCKQPSLYFFQFDSPDERKRLANAVPGRNLKTTRCWARDTALLDPSHAISGVVITPEKKVSFPDWTRLQPTSVRIRSTQKRCLVCFEAHEAASTTSIVNPGSCQPCVVLQHLSSQQHLPQTHPYTPAESVRKRQWVRAIFLQTLPMILRLLQCCKTSSIFGISFAMVVALMFWIAHFDLQLGPPLARRDLDRASLLAVFFPLHDPSGIIASHHQTSQMMK